MVTAIYPVPQWSEHFILSMKSHGAFRWSSNSKVEEIREKIKTLCFKKKIQITNGERYTNNGEDNKYI